jgi:hypothetical protein
MVMGTDAPLNCYDLIVNEVAFEFFPLHVVVDIAPIATGDRSDAAPRRIEYKDQHCSGLCDVCRCNGRDQLQKGDASATIAKPRKQYLLIAPLDQHSQRRTSGQTPRGRRKAHHWRPRR